MKFPFPLRRPWLNFTNPELFSSVHTDPTLPAEDILWNLPTFASQTPLSEGPGEISPGVGPPRTALKWPRQVFRYLLPLLDFFSSEVFNQGAAYGRRPSLPFFSPFVGF